MQNTAFRSTDPRKKTQRALTAVLLAALLICSAVFMSRVITLNPDEEDVSSAQVVTTTQSVSETSDISTSLEADFEWAGLPTTEIALTDEPLDITLGGTYILSGNSTAGVVISTDQNVRIILNGVNITSSTGAAINVQSADNTVVSLAAGSQNYLEDSANRTDPEIDATLYSADDLFISGQGKLTVVSNFADGIVSNDDLTIYSGELVVDSFDEGIRGSDSLHIIEGTISVSAGDDGVKASNDSEEDKGYILIEGGSLTVDAVDDAIKAASSVTVNGGDVTVRSSYEGIEATNVTINGGNVTIAATDDTINAVSSELGGEVFISITGGNVDITAQGMDSDGLDANGYISISGGTLNITLLTGEPTSPIDYDTTASFTGGTVIIDGEEVSELPEPSGPAGGRGTGGPPPIR